MMELKVDNMGYLRYIRHLTEVCLEKWGQKPERMRHPERMGQVQGA